MDEIAADSPWHGFEPDRARRWQTHFFEQPPVFPGATFMALAYKAHQSGKYVGMGWAQVAHEAERVGFDPSTYLLLRNVLSRASLERHPSHPHHGFKIGKYGFLYRLVDLPTWAMWLELVDSGKRPSHAAETLLSWLDEFMATP